MQFEELSLADCAAHIVDNRGKTCPVGDIGRPLIATNCLRDGSLYPTYETTRFVSEDTYRTWFRGHPEPGDLIFVTKGSPGRVCLAPNPVDFCIAQDMVSIRADERKVYSKYLFAVLRSDEAQRRIANMHVGTLIPHFKKGDFDKLLLPIPPRPVQEFIGDLYFDLSARIDLLQRTNTTLEAIAQALFKSWLVNFDPVRAKQAGREPEGMDAATAALFPAEFEESALGLIPKGWRMGTIRDVCSIYDSRRIPLSGKDRAARKGPYPYYGAAALMDYVDDFLFDGVYVLLGEDGSVTNADGTPVTQYVWGKFWVNNHAHVLQGANGVCTEHLMLGLRGVDFTPYVTGAVQAKLNQANLFRVPFLIPSAEVSAVFESDLAALYEKLRSNVEQIQTLAEMRDALLPRLISGKLRLPEAQEQLEDALA